MSDRLEPVPAQTYSMDYFLNECDGYDEYEHTNAKVLTQRLANGSEVSSDRIARSAVHDPVSRERKAAKILAILRHACGYSLATVRCLDVGCASGLILRSLAPHFRWAIGLEYNAQAVGLTNNQGLENLCYVRGDAVDLPLPDESVDLVLCTQVYEHVADPDGLAAELLRVLVPGGVCFFSGPNKLYPVELHYGLPLIHWLPASWAGACLRVFGRGRDYDVHSLTPRDLRRRLAGFQIQDLTILILRDPQTYAVTEELGRLAWVTRLPDWLLRVLVPFVPNVNWVLRKPVQVGD